MKLHPRHDQRVLESSGKEIVKLHDKLYPKQSYFVEVREEKAKNPRIVATSYGATVKTRSGKKLEGFSLSLRPAYFQLSKQQREKVLRHEVAHMDKPGHVSKHNSRFNARLKTETRLKRIGLGENLLEIAGEI